MTNGGNAPMNIKGKEEFGALPRVCIAADSSGSGKTTLTCGILKALKNRGLNPAAFKCGPDYIDPLFHREVTGAHSSNLDHYFFDEETIKYLLRENFRNSDVAVIEGVMGYYDGLGGVSTDGSTYDLSLLTETPVILIENCRNASLTVAARVKGLSQFRNPSFIRAVILNEADERLYGSLKPAIEGETGLTVLGYLPRMKDCVIGSRHLGLVTAAEIEDLGDKVRRISERLEETTDIPGIIRLAHSAPPLGFRDIRPQNDVTRKVRIGVARDRAFCFYYEDNFELLRKLEAELIFFSPLADARLPEGLNGLYLGGGYPELYAAVLSKNESMLRDVRMAVKSGMPCVAECGGFMYLHRTLVDEKGNSYTMADVILGVCRMRSALVRFGYAAYTAKSDTLLCAAGETIRGHEFHYWDSDCPGDSFSALKPISGREWPCIVSHENLCAGFPHFHFYANPTMANRFLAKCEAYGG